MKALYRRLTGIDKKAASSESTLTPPPDPLSSRDSDQDLSISSVYTIFTSGTSSPPPEPRSRTSASSLTHTDNDGCYAESGHASQRLAQPVSNNIPDIALPRTGSGAFLPGPPSFPSVPVGHVTPSVPDRIMSDDHSRSSLHNPDVSKRQHPVLDMESEDHPAGPSPYQPYREPYPYQHNAPYTRQLGRTTTVSESSGWPIQLNHHQSLSDATRGNPIAGYGHDHVDLGLEDEFRGNNQVDNGEKREQLADHSTTTYVDNVGNGMFGNNYGNITMISTQVAPARDAPEPNGKILDWLDGSNFAKMLKTAWDQHMAGTSRWFFQCEEFRRFTERAGTMLWGAGPPGAGKTFLSAAAVMELRSVFHGRDGVAVVYAFLRFDEKHSSRNIFAGILSQLLQNTAWSIDSQELRGVPESRNPWRVILDHRARGEPLGERELLDILGLAVGRFHRVFMVIDGLDEADDGTKETLLSALIPFRSVNILITSRPLEELAALYAPHALRVYITAHAEDIHLYVAERVRKSPKVQAILRISRDGPTLLARLTNRIREMSNGMFLVAHLHMEAVVHNANTPASLFSTLEDLPVGVTDAYHHTLKRINAQSKGNSSLAKRLFIWLLHANRKLSAHDMQCALAVSNESFSYAPGDMVPISLAISACGGLVEVRENVEEDSHASFAVADEVSFIHATTLEFMRSITFPDYWNPNEMLCTTCLAYMNAYPEAIDALRTAAREDDSRSMEEVLLASGHWSEMLVYALENWGHHAREAAKAGGPLHPHIVDFLMHCSDYPIERRWLHRQNHQPPGLRNDDESTASQDRTLTVVSGLHLAVMYNLVDVIRSKVLPYSCPPHGSNKEIITPLSLAAVRGHADLREVILEAYPEALQLDSMPTQRVPVSPSSTKVVCPPPKKSIFLLLQQALPDHPPPEVTYSPTSPTTKAPDVSWTL